MLDCKSVAKTEIHFKGRLKSIGIFVENVTVKVCAPLYRYWDSVQAVRPVGGNRGIALLFLDYGTRRGEGSVSRSGRSLPRERSGAHCTGGWMGLRAGMDRCGKSRLSPGFDPRTVQPLVSRYTDYANRPLFL